MTIIRQLVLVVELSTNRKTGEVSATYSPIQTCPKDCVFMNRGCYAQSGFCGIKFRRMSQAAKALSVEEIVKMECDGIRKLTGTKPLRLHVTGDCLDSESAIQLADACAEYTSRTTCLLGRTRIIGERPTENVGEEFRCWRRVRRYKTLLKRTKEDMRRLWYQQDTIKALRDSCSYGVRLNSATRHVDNVSFVSRIR